MLTRQDLQKYVLEAISAQGGQAKLIDVAKYIWLNYERELKASGDLFYTWQYDMRWAATKLRESGKVKAADSARIWELT